MKNLITRESGFIDLRLIQALVKYGHIRKHILFIFNLMLYGNNKKKQFNERDLEDKPIYSYIATNEIKILKLELNISIKKI